MATAIDEQVLVVSLDQPVSFLVPPSTIFRKHILSYLSTMLQLAGILLTLTCTTVYQVKRLSCMSTCHATWTLESNRKPVDNVSI